MLFRQNPALGVPLYLQLMEQVKHAIETGALRPGDQLPGIRPLAEELAINPNTAAKAYRELEHEGVIELHNGAGKTTAIKVLLGMVHPTSGEARVFGLDAANEDASLEIRRRTGFVAEDKGLYGSMDVADVIRFTASFYPKWRRDLEQRYLRTFDLPVSRNVNALSKGMRTKVDHERRYWPKRGMLEVSVHLRMACQP